MVFMRRVQGGQTGTTLLYFELYSWYYMPSTAHKILVHGIDFVKYSTIRIGML